MTDTQGSRKKKSRVSTILGIAVVIFVLYLLWYFVAEPVLAMNGIIPCPASMVAGGLC